MIDQKTLSYINLYAVLGTLKELCELDPTAKDLIAGERISIGFAVRGGPSATLVFADGACRLVDGCQGCTIKIPLSSPEKFNRVIDGKATPIPTRGFLHLGFLLKKFTKLTDLLTKYLRASEEDLADESFFAISTRLMLHVIGRAIVQIANQDKVGKASASYITDGKIKLEITGSDTLYIDAKDHTLSEGDAGDITAAMSFRDLHLARALFDGKVNAVAAVGLGDVRICGMVSQVDNINRILDRVSLYLA